MIPLLNLAKTLIGVGSNVLNKRTERIQNKDNIAGRIALAKQEGQDRIELSLAEWENLKAKNENGEWKDEFVTVIILTPFITSMLGALLAPFGLTELAEASTNQFMAIKDMGIDYSLILVMVISAAIGIRAWKK